MVLYHITSTYQLLCAMVYSRKKDEKSVALCSTWLKEKFPQVDGLTQFFDKVVFADFSYRFFNTDKATEKYFNGFIGDLKDYSEIYVWGAHFSFGFLLSYKNIPYIYCEDAAGMISRPDVIRNIDKNDNVKSRFWKQCDGYGAYDGSGKNVLKKLCNVSAQTDAFQVDETVIDFNVIRELQTLSVEEREQILLFFNPPRGLHIKENATLLLTEHMANLGTTSFEGQILLYQMVVDYFFDEGNLVIKPHPDDMMYYSQLFPKAELIRERFPAEFMPFIFDNKADCVATVSSTAIFNLRGHYKKVFELDARYERDFEMTHRYYAALMIAQRLGMDIICFNANDVLARRLSETLGENGPEVKRDISTGDRMLILIDDVTSKGEQGRTEVLNLLQQVDQTSCIVFINSKGDYCWYDYGNRELWENISPFVLSKKVHEPRSQDFYASDNDEVIYIYAKDKELLNMAKGTEIEKSLPHTGLTLENVKLGSQEERIKMLEGILAATEKRLLYYIEKEKMDK